MASNSFRQVFRRALVAALLAHLLIVAPARGWQGAPPARATAAATNRTATLTAAERGAAALISAAAIREITTALSSNEMQGRGTAQPGGDRAARYIADRLARYGFKPLGDAGTYLQAIKFRSAQVLPETSFSSGGTPLKMIDDFVVMPPLTSEQADVSGDLVFAGHGVTSTELKRDDFTGLDVKGKVVVVMGGRPNNVDEAAWRKAASPQSLIINLLRRGAAGLVLVNITREQPYALLASYMSRRSVERADSPDVPFRLPPILLASEQGIEKLFAGTGMTFAQARERAAAGEFVSRELKKPAAISIRVKKEEGTSSNVVGLLEGSDPKLKSEAVVYTAHYDAYGMASDGRIYPGAADNALGVAEILSIAEAFAKSRARPRRSVIILALTGEEFGLLGAEHWVRNPTWPIEKLAANLNFDGIGTEVYGPVKKIVGFGMEHSDLGRVLEGVVAATGTTIIPDPLPEEKAFYRSDHYAFVKRGVPALMLLGGPEGDTAAFVARMKKWLETDYHSTSDTVRPEWNWEGPRALAVVGLIAGMRIANAEAMPAWLSSSPFNRPRGTNEPPPPMN